MAWARTISVLLVAGAVASAGEATVEKTTWRDLAAFRLSDGRVEAVVVPKLGGRVMVFGLAGGANFIWNGPPGVETKPDAQPWGGEKTYIGPHTMWKFTQPRMWPPPAPDTTEHSVEMLTGGRLRTVSPAWESYGGARVVREYGFDASGDFVMTHSIAPVPGSERLGAIWVIAQTVPSEAVYVPLKPASPYKDNFFWFDPRSSKLRKGAQVLSPSLLQIKVVTGEGFKLGASPKRPALVAIKGDLAFVQRADAQDGQYPEGADEAGMSVEVYHHSAPGAGEYTELEFLSPLRRLDQGATLTTRWSIRPAPGALEPAAIEELLAR